MACMIVLAPALATMATTQLARVVRCEPALAWQPQSNVERTPLRMNWVVVTDADGSRRLRMCWKGDGD